MGAVAMSEAIYSRNFMRQNDAYLRFDRAVNHLFLSLSYPVKYEARSGESFAPRLC
jgi:hypothetical protein